MRHVFLRTSVLLVLFAMAGCGPPASKVAGKVICNGKPVQGSILFSPAGEGDNNTGPAVAAPLKDDGTYTLELKTSGKHRIAVSPSDMKYSTKPGDEYPCDLATIERDIKSGANEIVIDLPPHKK